MNSPLSTSAVRDRWRRRIDLPYAALNLRYNPFGELTREQRLETAVPRCDLDAVEQFLSRDRAAVQFIGPAGSGKSTHLLCLVRRIPEFRYLHLPEDEKRRVPVRENLMIDEAQRLAWHQRKRLWQAARRIVLGTHSSLERSMNRAGFEVLTFRLERQPDADWLQRTINRKLEAARRTSETPLASMDESTAVKLIQKFGNNVRAIERHLYEQVQQFEQRASAGEVLYMQMLFKDEAAIS